MRLAGDFFLSQSAQSSLSLLAHISSPQNAFGIQRTQSVSAIVDTNKEAKSSLHPPNMGISVITPLPFGGGVGGGAAIFLAFVCSVLLCKSVRNRMHPLVEIRPMRVAGKFLLSQRVFLSLTELTDLTEPICALSRTHRRPSAYRYHRALLPMKIPIRRQEQPSSSP